MKLYRIMLTLALLSLLLIPLAVYAHEEITVGDYKIEYGWLVEPPVVGLANSVVLNIRHTKNTDTPPDITALKVEAVYGSESKVLFLKPLRGGKIGQYVADLLPTRPGQYTIRLSGKIGTTEVKTEIKPEEVEPAETVQFPRVTSGQAADSSLNIGLWLSVGAIALAVLGAGLSLFALTRKK